MAIRRNPIAGPLSISVMATVMMIENVMKRATCRDKRRGGAQSMGFSAIIARPLFYVTSGTVEESRRFCFGLVIEPRSRLLLVSGALQFQGNPLEVCACFLLVAKPPPSVCKSGEQFSTWMHAQLGKPRLLQ